MAQLKEQEISERLKNLPEWERSDMQLVRTLKFESFDRGINFVDRVAKAADEMNHHPDIDIRYTTIKLALTSHDVGALTDRDFRLAAKINEMVQDARQSG